ncbi:FecR domain-containing protein [Methylobacillus arboreus]|uniref:FecR family protein n=1 Tax=Methylobacillus arboreus TaxID=755170 RepID=UPI001E2CF47C|nr:FecR domain-containing protein [Methylobacillus arboreus]MCB5190935.1 FecR domain-containing protein [Methylobacillus arboreus]
MSDKIAEQAAEWLVRLSDAAEAGLREQFQQWQAADPRHAEAVRQMQGLIAQLEEMQPQAATAHAAIKAGIRRGKRPDAVKRSAGALLAVLALALPLWLILQHYPPGYLLADLRTATAEWETSHLPDQSMVTLNGNTAVNIDFTHDARNLSLIQGEILVDVAKDPARPFIVKTAHGSITALSTRFVVSHQYQATRVSMLESSVAVRAGQQPGKPAIVTQGETVTMIRDGVGPVRGIDADSINDAWKLHQLVVQDQSLSEVLTALSRHRRGYLRFDPQQLAQYQVTAVLPLDDTDQALHLLGESFPLRIRSFTPWLVVVDPAPAAVRAR